MAQTVAATPQAIYDTLVADTAFMAEVGTYTFKTGTTADSISIVTPGAKMPELHSQSGLEVIVHDFGDAETKMYLTNSPDILVAWKVFLIVWHPADGVSAMAAVQRILELFPQAKTTNTVSSSNVLGVDFQTQVLIPSTCPIIA